MQFSRTFFEICLIMTTLLIAAILVFALMSPLVVTLDALVTFGFIPLGCAAGTAIFGVWSKLTRMEWSGYVRASLVLVGGMLGVLFGASTLAGILAHSATDIVVHNATVFGVGGAMLFTSIALRRRCPSCLPQLKSLVSLNW